MTEISRPENTPDLWGMMQRTTIISMDSNSPHAPEQKTQSAYSFAFDLLRFTILTLLIVIPIRAYVAEPFIVSGESMDDTFRNGDYLIVERISYRFEEPTRGDVIVFHPPRDPGSYYIKRIIGLPGETVRIIDGVVTIINNENPQGFALNEPYIGSESYDSLENTLGEEEYFVMGDNRSRSSDSRAWGALERSAITGRAYVRLLPVNKIRILPGTFSDYLKKQQ